MAGVFAANGFEYAGLLLSKHHKQLSHIKIQ